MFGILSLLDLARKIWLARSRAGIATSGPRSPIAQVMEAWPLSSWKIE